MNKMIVKSSGKVMNVTVTAATDCATERMFSEVNEVELGDDWIVLRGKDKTAVIRYDYVGALLAVEEDK